MIKHIKKIIRIIHNLKLLPNNISCNEKMFISYLYCLIGGLITLKVGSILGF